MMPHAQQPSLWDRIRRKKAPKAAPPAPVSKTAAREIPLTEKTLPAKGALVRYIGVEKTTQKAQAKLYRLDGVMLCGPTCYVLLRPAGATDGDMKVEIVEALTLA